jgi:hypothetical protein
MTIPDPLGTIRAGLDEASLDVVATMERVKETYFETPLDATIAEELKKVLQQLVERPDTSAPASPNNVGEARGFVVSGQARAGKSRALREVFRNHPCLPGYGNREADCPLVTVIPQGACTLPRFAQDVFEQLGLPIVNVPSGKNYEVKLAHMIRDRLKVRGVKLLHVDEAHHVTEPANKTEIKKVVNMFKYLMIHQDWPVAVILSGIPVLVSALGRDPQITGRVAFKQTSNLVPKKDAKRVGHVVAELANVAGLAVAPDDLATITPRLIHAGNRQLGRSIEITYDAIRLALTRREKALSPKLFALAYSAARGVAPDHNPFVARDWQRTDPLLVLEPEPKEVLRARKVRRTSAGTAIDAPEDEFA